jgi:secreted trypsin-like serine protease
MRKLWVVAITSGVLAAQLMSAQAVVSSTSIPVSGVKYSWVVTLHTTFEGDRSEHVCTGSLIDDYTVVTAAHCLVALDQEDWVIVQGRVNSADRGRVLTPFDYKIHPEYDPITSNNDVALIYLYYPAYSSKHLKLAGKQAKFTESSMYLYGWGVDESGSITDQLRRAQQKLAPKSAIRKYFKSYDATTQLATLLYVKKSDSYAGACKGDSGGPLVKTIKKVDYLVGLVSYGGQECNSPAPTVYTKISTFRSWLTETKSAAKIKHAADISISTDPFYITGGKTLPVTELSDTTTGNNLRTTVKLVTGDLPNTEIDISSLTVDSYATAQQYGSVALWATNVGSWDACSLTTRGFIEVRIDVDGKLGSDRIWQYGDISTGCITDGDEMFMVKTNAAVSDLCKARIQTTSTGPKVWFTAECFSSSKTALFRMLLADGEAADVEPGSDNWMGPVVIRK